MNRIFLIVKNDLYRQFCALSTYILGSCCLLFSGIIFFSYLGSYNKLISQKLMVTPEQMDRLNINIQVLEYYYGAILFMMLFVTPIIVSKVLTEDYRNHILQFLIVSGIKSSSYIYSKIISIMIVLIFLLMLVSIFPICLVFLEKLPIYSLIGGSFSLILCIVASICLSILMCVLSRFNPLASLLTIVFTIILFVLEVLGNRLSGFEKTICEQLSLFYHSRSMIEGLITLSDFSYFLVFCFISIILANRILSSEHWR